MEKINIAELLKNCPKGMELDCATYENVVFDYVDNNNDTFPIKCHIKLPDNKCSICTFTIYGGISLHTHAKCVIFPKGKTTWEGFVPPCQFKDGDIVYIKTKGHNHNEFIIIFKEIKNDHIHKHACFAYQVLYTNPNAVCHLVDIEEIRIATEEERQKLFDAIKANGYRWDEETKTLEKLIQPKFKVGDYIRHNKKTSDVCLISEVCDNHYLLDEKDTALPFFAQDNWELVPNKFDINTLIPFESKVLVRDDDVERWRPTFWGFYDNDDAMNYPYDCMGSAFAQCIPYENNEHLLGTSNKCNDFYKTW